MKNDYDEYKENEFSAHLNVDFLEKKAEERELIWERVITIALSTLIVLLGFFTALYFLFYRPPSDFPVGVVVKVEEGLALQDVANMLEDESVVRSSLALRMLVEVIGSERSVVAGEYYFKEAEDLRRVASRLLSGDYGLDPIAITIPEGATVVEMAEIFEDTFPEFDSLTFVELAAPHEGYLFPDTYNFLPTVDEEQIIKVMSENFDEKISSIEGEVAGSGRTLEEIVIMASLLEKEAAHTEVRRMISGILWNRIEIGMLLQVDAVFPYIMGKNTYQVTLDDLQFDSPYNTYKYEGLPAGPIANPGLDSIQAAIEPIESDYLFYLADRNGKTYYARTFEEHQQNRVRYLN